MRRTLIHMQDVGHAPASGTGSRLEVCLLGGFEVTIGGTALPAERWPSLRAAHLVQLLALQPRHRMQREQAVDALWPQLAPESGGANLRKALHHARKALGRPEAIVQQAGELVLWPDGPVAVDAEVFEQRALAALSSGDPARCAAVAAQGAGELLPGTRYEPWSEPSRERLHSLRLALLRSSAQWELVAQLDPTDEPAHRALIRRALDAGNRAEALRWYARLRAALRDTLGAPPDDQTEALYARCLDGLLAEPPELVGREIPMARFSAWLRMPQDERAGGIVLQGPAGIGKSALCRAFAARARTTGCLPMRVDANESGRTYAVISAVAEHLVLGDRSLLERVGAPARSVLATLTSLAEPADPQPGPLGRHQVVGAIRRLLIAAAPAAGVLLMVDDAHQAGDADVDVLLQLAAAGGPLGLVLAVRPPQPGSALASGIARLERAGVLQVLDLEPLRDEDTRRLVAAQGSLPQSLLAQVVQAAEGNPFAAIELARCAASGGTNRLDEDSANAIAQRLCEVPDVAGELLDWLAVCGDPLAIDTAEALAAEAGLQPQQVLEALDAALATGVIVPSGSGVRFRHEIARQALARRIPPHRRRMMHRRIATVLGTLGAAPATVARHWLDAGSPREAAPWQLAAAREALRLAAFGDTLRHLAPLLELAPTHPEGLRMRAEALDAMGEPEALAAYRKAAQAAAHDMRDDLLAKAALAQVKLGDPKGAIVALEGLQPTSVEGRLCEALAYAGAAALGVADPAAGTAKAAVARRLALDTGDTASLVIASWAQAAAAHARGELHRSVWADLRETSHVPQLAVRVFDGHLCITQRFLYGARPYPEVIAFADELARESRRLGAARGTAFATTLRGEAEWLSGRLTDARLHLREGARLHRAIGGAVGEALSLQRLAELELHAGRRHEARALIDEALDLARQTDIGFHLLDRIYGTRIAMHGDDPLAALHVMEDAAASVRGPLETCPGCRITFAVPAAIAAARAGELALAERQEAQCAYLADVVMRLPAWYAAHEEVLGHIATARGAPAEEAARRFATAGARFRVAGQPIDAARCERLASEAGTARSGTRHDDLPRPPTSVSIGLPFQESP